MHLKYRPDIDGLRALAVISVIVYHLNNRWLPGGFIGVDVFFVISGFLITKIIYREIISHQFSFINFYQRRINRILPVFFTVMFCTSLVAWYLFLPEEFMLFLRSLKSTTFFGQNIFFAENTGGYWDLNIDRMPILNTWSLAVEEQFYIILPFTLLFLLGIKFKTKRKILKFKTNFIIIVLLILAIISFTLAQISPKFSFLNKYNYYSLLTGRSGELLIGSIIGIFQAKNNNIPSSQTTSLYLYNILTFIGTGGVIFSFIFISHNNLFPSLWALIPTLGTGLILYFHHPKTIISRFFSIRPLVFIGKISYSLYLWHWPVIVLAKKYILTEKSGFGTTKHYILVTIIFISLSIISYFFVEQPCRTKKKNFKFSLIAYYIVPSIFILSIYYIQVNTNFLYYKYKDRIDLYNLQKTPNWKGQKYKCRSIIDGECIYGDTSKSPNAILIGDSHAGNMFGYIDLAGAMYGFSVRLVDYNGYTFLPGQKQLANDVINKNKEIVLNKTFKWIEDSDIIFYCASYSYHKDLISREFPIFLDNLINKGKTIIVLKDLPILNSYSVNQYYISYLKSGIIKRNLDFLNFEEKSGNELVKNIIKTKNNQTAFWNPFLGLTKKQQEEWPFYNGIMVYYDFSHLNVYGANNFPKFVLPKQKAFWERIARIANKSN
ncbi:acyltransferase [Apibacter muscae]|uniref:acyltransferase family protein n=1 Tax=Apibacter muscae TaxID=2509004 RepID=UPI0011AC5AC9|nr:acyltransferase family protein [Apibacter muscae]TWP24723.1 acyltransferase [Apibacter muscae]